MKEQSQAPDLQEREVVPEREYQRVTISGEEKCGVGLHSKHRLPERPFLPLSPSWFSPPGSLHRSFGCCQMRGEGSVHQTEVHGPVAAEFLQDHCSISAGAERKAPGLGYL